MRNCIEESRMRKVTQINVQKQTAMTCYYVTEIRWIACWYLVVMQQVNFAWIIKVYECGRDVTRFCASIVVIWCVILFVPLMLFSFSITRYEWAPCCWPDVTATQIPFIDILPRDSWQRVSTYAEARKTFQYFKQNCNSIFSFLFKLSCLCGELDENDWNLWCCNNPSSFDLHKNVSFSLNRATRFFFRYKLLSKRLAAPYKKETFQATDIN